MQQPANYERGGMTKWWQILIATLDVPPALVVLAVAFFVMVLIFALLWIAMRRGHRVSLGGSKGFVFEALPPTRQPQKGQK